MFTLLPCCSFLSGKKNNLAVPILHYTFDRVLDTVRFHLTGDVAENIAEILMDSALEFVFRKHSKPLQPDNQLKIT